MTNRRWHLSNLTALLACIGICGTGTAMLFGCSDSGSSSDSGTGGTTSNATGGTSSGNSGGSSNATTSSPTSPSTGGTSSTNPSSSSTDTSCKTIDASSAATGPYPIVNVELVPEKNGNVAYTQIAGYPWDGPQVKEAFVEDGEAGSCKVLKVATFNCSPQACNATAVTCTGENEWTRNPVKKADGTLSFTGINLEDSKTEFTLSAIANLYQPTATAKVVYPPCTAGNAVSVTGGTEANAYTLTAKCIDPVVVTSATPMPFESGKPATFTWTPSSDANSRIAIEIDVSHHGGLKGVIRCDVPDTGSATVDAALVTKLIGYGTAGFPDATLTRHSIGTTKVGTGTATLDIKSTTSVSLEVPGVTSCSDTLPCATGQCTSAKCQ